MIIYSRTALAVDNDGNITNLITVGSKSDSVKVYDLEGNLNLEKIYEQLKISNFHLSLLTGNFIHEIGDS